MAHLMEITRLESRGVAGILEEMSDTEMSDTDQYATVVRIHGKEMTVYGRKHDYFSTDTQTVKTQTSMCTHAV